MELNIYEKVNGKYKAVKTYKASVYKLMFGTVEDVAKIVDLENLNVNSNTELVQVVADLALKSIDVVRGLMLDIFDDLDEDELRKVPIEEVAQVLIEVIRFTVRRMYSKN